jgi:molybdenum cofactor biosynthesis protein MoaC
MKKQKLSHYNSAGAVSMVDVSAKPVTSRTAIARAYVAMPKAVLAALPQNKKGDPLEIARIAGISAAKKTADLIPLCHQLPLSHDGIEFRLDRNRDYRQRADRCPNWGRNGSDDRRSRRRSDHLRHDKGTKQSDRDSPDPST